MYNIRTHYTHKTCVAACKKATTAMEHINHTCWKTLYFLTVCKQKICFTSTKHSVLLYRLHFFPLASLICRLFAYPQTNKTQWNLLVQAKHQSYKTLISSIQQMSIRAVLIYQEITPSTFPIEYLLSINGRNSCWWQANFIPITDTTIYEYTYI